MKELTIEQKAKAYDEAIKRAKELLEIGVKDTRDKMVVLSFFPELKESDDEKIKQRVIKLIKMSNEVGGFALHKWEADEALSWLEKQGEQKPTDKIEPKFRIGDFVKNTNYQGEPIYEIVYIDKECYICEYRGGKENMGDKTVMHFAFDNPYLRLVEQKPADKVEPKFHEGQWITIKE